MRTFSGVDISDEIGINEMFKNIKQEFGEVHIVVNNAGISGPVKHLQMPISRNLEILLLSISQARSGLQFRVCRQWKQEGKIITITTFFTEENRYEQRPYRFRTPYTAHKGQRTDL